MGRPHHRRLILVKHAEPVVESRVPPNRWELSERGRGQSVALAERLRRYRPAAVVASEEPKAMQTACLAADRLGVAAATFRGLHEHDRTGAPFGTQAEFELAAKGFFGNPGALVWGKETWSCRVTSRARWSPFWPRSRTSRVLAHAIHQGSQKVEVPGVGGLPQRCYGTYDPSPVVSSRICLASSSDEAGRSTSLGPAERKSGISKPDARWISDGMPASFSTPSISSASVSLGAAATLTHLCTVRPFYPGAYPPTHQVNEILGSSGAGSFGAETTLCVCGTPHPANPAGRCHLRPARRRLPR
jgi:hypothetical protein